MAPFTSRAFRLLPLLLLAIMVAIGLGLEAALYEGPSWLPKLPLIALLAAAFWKGR
jgi:hypothetical protein